MLDELAEIGMELARDLRRQAADPDHDGGDLGLKFARVARAVRQTLALQTRLEEAQALQVRETQARAAKATLERQLKARDRRYEASDVVERLMEAENPDWDMEAFDTELADWLADQNRDTFLDAPLGEVVAAICRDLELSPDWSRWSDEAWAADAAAAAEIPEPPDPPDQPDPPQHADLPAMLFTPAPTATPPPCSRWMS